MSAPENKAVFLSYASQDAAAAQRICETLRSAGVEVWFDQSELVGGDAWDQKIRRQIAECALFVPVISASTQARGEGYFRIEWRLAAQRTHAMADDTTFLLPVVIDETRDTEARVPAEFKAVQWTRLPGGGAAEKFCERVAALLDGGAAPQPAPGGTKRELKPRAASPAASSRRRWPLTVAAALALLIAAGAWSWLGRPASVPSAETTRDASSTTAAAAPAAPLSEARKLAAKAESLVGHGDDAPRATLDLAETLLQQAIKLDPSDGEIRAVFARVHLMFVANSLDTSAERRANAKTQAELAVKLAPESFEARLALANHFRNEAVSRDEGTRRLRALVAERPSHQRAVRTLGGALRLTATRAALEEAIVFYDRADALEGGDASACYGKYLTLFALGRDAEAEAALDRAVGLLPCGKYVSRKIALALHRGDLPAAQVAVKAIPAPDLLDAEYAYFAAWVWLWSGKWQEALDVWKGIPSGYSEGSYFTGPTDYVNGLTLHALGRKQAAVAAWRAALQQVEKRIADQPASRALLGWKGVLLARLGQNAEAARLFHSYWQSPARSGSHWLAVLNHRVLAAELRMRAGEIGPEAMAFLRSRTREFPPAAVVLRHEPEFLDLQADPVFRGLRDEVAPEVGATPAVPKPDDKSVAVLAFANLSDDKANEHFSDGISEELLNVLAKVPGLKVSARTSAFFFKGKNTPVPEIARQLGVAYVVEGSVRKAGPQVRITAQLVKAADGFPVWSDSFPRELKDIFAVQDEIAGLIAKNLSLKLGVAPGRSPANPEAYGLLLQGRFFARQESNAGRKQSLEFYRRALGIDPGYAIAWAEMAQSYIKLARFGGMATADGMREARSAAEKSLSLDPDQPVALDALGWVQRTADWDWRAAQKSFQRALALAPEDAAILTGASILYFNVGRVDEARALARKAADRDPLNAMAQINLGDLLMQAGGNPQCIEPMSRGLKLAPGVEEFRAHLAIALAQLKRDAEADAAIEQEPNESYRLWGRGIIAGIRGDRAGVARAREALVAKNDVGTTGYVAMLFIAEGKYDDAFAWLERSVRERDSSVCWVKTALYYDPIRNDPRWMEFLRKLGLADDQLR